MQALMIAAPALGLIGLGVAGIALFGRDPEVDEYTVDDYRPALNPARRDWPLVDRQDAGRRWLRPGSRLVDVLPPAPPGIRVPLTLYAEQVVAELMRARYGTTNPVQIAGRILREIAAEQSGDIVWTSTAERDLTAFPFVAVAR